MTFLLFESLSALLSGSGKGVTIALFHLSGTQPSLIKLLKVAVIGGASINAGSKGIQALMPFGPAAFPALICIDCRLTSEIDMMCVSCISVSNSREGWSFAIGGKSLENAIHIVCQSLIVPLCVVMSHAGKCILWIGSICSYEEHLTSCSPKKLFPTNFQLAWKL